MSISLMDLPLMPRQGFNLLHFVLSCLRWHAFDWSARCSFPIWDACILGPSLLFWLLSSPVFLDAESTFPQNKNNAGWWWTVHLRYSSPEIIPKHVDARGLLQTASKKRIVAASPLWYLSDAALPGTFFAEKKTPLVFASSNSVSSNLCEQCLTGLGYIDSGRQVRQVSASDLNMVPNSLTESSQHDVQYWGHIRIH